MDYLKPIENLKQTIAHYRLTTFILSGLLGLLLLVLPMTLQEGNPVIVQNDDSIALAKKEPWKLSIQRLEKFTTSYLSSRFEWSEQNFSQQQEMLKDYVSERVYQRLKDSLSALESVARSQHARSFYVLEGIGLSNEKHKIEAKVTRILRIQNLAVATPLTVQIEYRECAISNKNPYGIEIASLEELEVH